jgi:hypothetical protein
MAVAAAASVVVMLVGCTAHSRHDSTGHLATAQPSDAAAVSPDPTDVASPTAAPATPTASPQSTSGSGHTPPVASAVVTAVTGSYRGLCPAPSDATTYKAVISVTRGPVTVTFRWTTSNGGDSDPSTQSIRFSGSGHQTRTVYHHESVYPPEPYPARLRDWVAVNLLTPIRAQSSHVPLTVACDPFTVRVTKVSGDYSGSCPPPGNAVKFAGDIVASAPIDVTVTWHLSNNGDSGADPTRTLHLDAGVNTISHSEMAYPPSPYPASRDDWVALDVTAGSFTATSNHASFTVSCTS